MGDRCADSAIFKGRDAVESVLDDEGGERAKRASAVVLAARGPQLSNLIREQQVNGGMMLQRQDALEETLGVQ